MKSNNLSSFRFAFYIIGVYLILDGIGSIVVYQNQPFFFDHFMRICRMLVGGLTIIIWEKACQ